MQEFRNNMPRFRQRVEEVFASQKDTGFLWAPVFIGIGTAIYFGLSFEPSLWFGAGLLIISSFLLIIPSRFILQRFLVGALCLGCLGFVAADLRTEMAYTPILKKEIKFASIEGRIESLELLESAGAVRAVLTDVSIEEIKPTETPRKLRLKLRQDDRLEVGMKIRILAGLNPPSRPVLPGGFNFQRHAYFTGVGAYGFAYRSAEILKDEKQISVFNWEGIRHRIVRIINDTMSFDTAAIASALMTGERAAISEHNQEVIRNSGLAHMLAISGLHISLVFGTVFFLLRAGLALFPIMALRYPIKKWAALGGMLAAIFYTFISGASIPTQRALLMLFMVFLAIILDRTPFSKRLVAFAAIVVLLVFPESLTGASFQMSFAAVAALVAFYEDFKPWVQKFHTKAGWFKRAVFYVIGVSMTTVVATFATAPITLYHFQQLAIYSLLANVLAVPVLTFIVMPFALLSFALMPLALEWMSLYVVEYGIELILEIANWVSGIEGAVFQVQQWPLEVLLWFTSGFLMLVIIQGYWRALGLVPLIIGCGLVFQVQRPDVIISESGKLIAIRHDEGYAVNNMRSERFELDNWTRAFAMKDSVIHWPSEGELGNLACDVVACRYVSNDQKLSFLKKEIGLKTECEWADLVVAAQAHEDCSTGVMVIDRLDLYYHGAHTLYLSENFPEINVKTVRETLGERPWNVFY